MFSAGSKVTGQKNMDVKMKIKIRFSGCDSSQSWSLMPGFKYMELILV
jgi:hypothetical protein